MNVNTPMLITFIIYILGMILIGFIAYYSTSGFEDYMLGGRSLGTVVTALSTGASDMSGWLLMGLPGAIFTSGITASWIAIGLTIGAWINWTVVAGRLRVQTEYYDNALTLPDFFTNRFEDHTKALRVTSVLIILVFFTIYCSSGVVAGAHLFEVTFHMSYQNALWSAAAATILYTLVGGFLAVSWTDTIQASLMIFALILTPIMVIITVGGFSDSLEIIKAKNPLNLNLIKGANVCSVISLLSWGLGYFGQPHILARFMASGSQRSVHKARYISMTWMILCLIGAVAIGFFGIAYFQNHPEQASEVNQNSERIFIELAQLLFNPWMSGVLLSAVLAAIMSTLSCQLLVSSSALTEDLYKGFFRKNASEKELVYVGRFMVLVIAIIAILIATNPKNRVLGLVGYAWAGFGASFGPVILFSLCWKRMTRNAALAGMIVGSITVFLWRIYGWIELYEIIPGFIMGTIAVLVVTLSEAPPSQSIQRRFAETETKYLKTAKYFNK
ncbi:sodium/proline symporter PutP [Candidatus Pantoea carbekii]|uniref:Sodium/proline symporter n=1 Tax=Candidatus Pantoea carbekii TaxID=1235990 RepID=U3U7X5_9GAMM|nr:sodium/proline symporter PutP [Candidatus Pantoea carbekii]AKC32029.1 sodium_proline symporter PutP [Candidatus Pantoea carbekii]BAO00552.1 PutP protein [Candidatus Pantoea carbekii]